MVVDGSAPLALLLGEPDAPADARAAMEAWRRFGKGRQPARLDLADCYSDALAVRRGESLLFVGDDFARTDVRPAL